MVGGGQLHYSTQLSGNIFGSFRRGAEELRRDSLTLGSEAVENARVCLSQTGLNQAVPPRQLLGGLLTERAGS